MKSKASTVEQYLAEVPSERREILATVRAVILENLPRGYEEAMNWGMITYQVPLATYPDTYNGQPLMYAALASQKNYMSIYLTGIYMDEAAKRDFEQAYRRTDKRYDAGKSCVRFRRLEDLPLDLIGQIIGALPVKEFIKRVKQLHPRK
jgi:uncharacterized protein YdhG (YjbR/CyaY superfamily)